MSHDDVAALLPTSRAVFGTQVIDAAAGLEVIARDRLSMASNDLAGIATSARPAVQARLLEVITELDELANDLRGIIISLRSGPDG